MPTFGGPAHGKLFALSTLIAAALLIAFRRGPDRAFWIGYLVVGGVYFASIDAPVLDRSVGYGLITTRALIGCEVFYLGSDRPNRARNADAEAIWFDGPLFHPFRDPTMAALVVGRRAAARLPPLSLLSLPQWTCFSAVGHSSLTCLLGLLGG